VNGFTFFPAQQHGIDIMINRYGTLAIAIALVSTPILLSAYTDLSATWRSETTSDGTSPSKRHEAGSVVVNGNLFVLGGRAEPPVEVYKPSTDGWENLGGAPLDIHHFQPVSMGSKIYIVGAMTGGFPNELSVPDVHVFNTDNNNWTTEGEVPVNRRRGGAGAVVYEGKIYVVGGNTMGHNGGAVGWLDAFDPATGTWTTLADAPTARDHFQAVVIGNQLIVAGGRQTDIPNPFDGTVAATNIYNFDSGQWRTAAAIPTERAGAIAVGVGSEIVVAGGEAAGQSTAFDTVEAYDVVNDLWRTLQPMQEGRHSGAGSILGDRLHMVAGSGGIGGAPEINSHESLSLVGGDEPGIVDDDNDGLSNHDELTLYFTDPALADSDDDGINDGDEIDNGTDPNDPMDPENNTGADGGADGSADGMGDGTGDGGADGTADGTDGATDGEVMPPKKKGGALAWPMMFLLGSILTLRRRHSR